MAIDIGTYAIKDDLTAQFARMSAAALSFDKALGNFVDSVAAKHE